MCVAVRCAGWIELEVDLFMYALADYFHSNYIEITHCDNAARMTAIKCTFYGVYSLPTEYFESYSIGKIPLFRPRPAWTISNLEECFEQIPNFSNSNILKLKLFETLSHFSNLFDWIRLTQTTCSIINYPFEQFKQSRRHRCGLESNHRAMSLFRLTHMRIFNRNHRKLSTKKIQFIFHHVRLGEPTFNLRPKSTDRLQCSLKRMHHNQSYFYNHNSIIRFQTAVN